MASSEDERPLTIPRFVFLNSTSHFYVSLTTASHTTSEIIKVYVAKERKLYNRYRSLLCQKCPFFDKCLNNPFKEGESHEVNLEEEGVTTFEQFVLWIYNQPLIAINSWALATAYILADTLMMESFKNSLVDKAKIVFRCHSFHTDGLGQLSKRALSESPMGNCFWA
jgi:BTB/POZ domain